MYIYNKYGYPKNERDIVLSDNLFTNKTVTVETIERMMRFIAQNAEKFLFYRAITSTTDVTDPDTTLDLSYIDWSKIYVGINSCFTFQKASVKNIIFDNINITLDTTNNGSYINNYYFFNVSASNEVLDSLIISNSSIPENNFIRGTSGSAILSGVSGSSGGIFNTKNLYILNSTLYPISFINNRASSDDQKLIECIIKDSEVNPQPSTYGYYLGTYHTTETLNIDLSTSTFVLDGTSTGLISLGDNPTITSFTLPNFKKKDGSSFTYISNGFSSASKLQEITFQKFEGFDNWASLDKWFNECNELEIINGMEDCGLDFSLITTAQRLFKNCYNLSSFPDIFLNLSGLTDVTGMFYGCNSITTFDLEINAPITNMSEFIRSSSNLVTFDGRNITINTANFTDSQTINNDNCYLDCPELVDINLDFMKCGFAFSLNGSFKNCPKVQKIYIPKETLMTTSKTYWTSGSGDSTVGFISNLKTDFSKLIIYTDAEYNFDYATQTASGTLPDNFIEKFNYFYDSSDGTYKGCQVNGNYTPEPEPDPIFDNRVLGIEVDYYDYQTNVNVTKKGDKVLNVYRATSDEQEYLTWANNYNNNKTNMELVDTNLYFNPRLVSGYINFNIDIQEYISSGSPKVLIVEVRNTELDENLNHTYHLAIMKFTELTWEVPDPTPPDPVLPGDPGSGGSSGGSGSSSNNGGVWITVLPEDDSGTEDPDEGEEEEEDKEPCASPDETGELNWEWLMDCFTILSNIEISIVRCAMLSMGVSSMYYAISYYRYYEKQVNSSFGIFTTNDGIMTFDGDEGDWDYSVYNIEDLQNDRNTLISLIKQNFELTDEQFTEYYQRYLDCQDKRRMSLEKGLDEDGNPTYKQTYSNHYVYNYVTRSPGGEQPMTTFLAELQNIAGDDYSHIINLF